MTNITKPCMLHLSVGVDEKIEKLHDLKDVYRPQGHKAPTRSDFVEDAINFYSETFGSAARWSTGVTRAQVLNAA